MYCHAPGSRCESEVAATAGGISGGGAVGTAKGEPTSILGRGLSASASMGESRSGFADRSCRPLLALLSVTLLTPQSSKSGKLSSSSPAQSMWLPGVFGLSMATARTRSTSASMSCLISKEGVSGGEEC